MIVPFSVQPRCSFHGTFAVNLCPIDSSVMVMVSLPFVFSIPYLAGSRFHDRHEAIIPSEFHQVVLYNSLLNSSSRCTRIVLLKHSRASNSFGKTIRRIFTFIFSSAYLFNHFFLRIIGEFRFNYQI